MKFQKMVCLRKSWIGLGVASVCLLLLLVIVMLLYYVMWKSSRGISGGENETDGVVIPSSNRKKKKKVHFFCWKTPSTIHHNASQGHSPPIVNSDPESDIELGCTGDVLVKSLDKESVDSELMRLHNLRGPPRFLFTIDEESKEDLESDDGKSRDERSRKASRSLIDLMQDTPFITPVASPRLKSLNQSSLSCYTGFNPLFESSAEAGLNRLISSAPPRFKFLRDAEEKFSRRLKAEAEKKTLQNGGGALPDSDSRTVAKQDKDSSVASATGKNDGEDHHRRSGCSQSDSRTFFAHIQNSYE